MVMTWSISGDKKATVRLCFKSRGEVPTYTGPVGALNRPGSVKCYGDMIEHQAPPNVVHDLANGGTSPWKCASAVVEGCRIREASRLVPRPRMSSRPKQCLQAQERSMFM